ncbi:N-6 DNA methylase [Amycolatopsis nalaikhensis]|uniref:N-6 DNA methylase n=1 Tax=Amycolatopsis nalaikhensis TaxID=715472 RepID=A0ABY8Y1U3_9PSEU|nr:N-6 DNA methylase [Amycolatopsis sp. 2-2]WIV61881.1 N-6 DNA methylase [Amycolatopsis sp. 2-2]
MSERNHGGVGSSGNTPINAEVHALKIAVEVASAWYKGRGIDGPEVALGTVATIATAGLLVDRPERLAAGMKSATPEGFVDIARQVWAATIMRRPDVAQWVHPLLYWLFTDIGARGREQVKRTADAALNAGQLELTATERRFDCDLLGPVLGALRSRTETRVNAQMYTPGDIASALIAVTLGDLKPGQTFCDDTVGTGGLFRVAAQVVRSRGVDPADMLWFGADVDELAVAATAVNGLIWGLGPRVFLHVGEILADPNWADKASRRRAVFLGQIERLNAGMAALDFLKNL